MKKESLSKAVCISTNAKGLEIGGYYYIDARESFMVRTKDDIPYVDVYTPNYEWLGMAPRRAFAILKTKDEARETLEALKRKYPGMETLYEDIILSAVGNEGLYTLCKHNLIEACAIFGGRKLYAI